MEETVYLFDKMDSIEWELVESIERPDMVALVPPCSFRYDEEMGVIYTEDVSEAKYTYIAASGNSNLFKVGRTGNLQRRIKELNSKKPYSLLQLIPLAYCEKDIESILKAVLPCGVKFPAPFDKATELLNVSSDDIEKLMKTFSFKRINEEIPGVILKTKRVNYDPLSGRCKSISYSYAIQP